MSSIIATLSTNFYTSHFADFGWFDPEKSCSDKNVKFRESPASIVTINDKRMYK